MHRSISRSIKNGNGIQNDKHIPSGSNCVEVIVAASVLNSNGFRDFLREDQLRFHSPVGTVRILRLYVAFTSKLSLSLLLLAKLVVQAYVRVSWVCTELSEATEPAERRRRHKGEK